MDPSLKQWACDGLDDDRLLATQTFAAFNDYYRRTGRTRQDLARELPRPLRAYKEPSRNLLAAIDGVTRQHKIEAWRAWGLFAEGREVTPATGERGVYSLAARWGVSSEKFCAVYFQLLGAIQSFIRLEQHADGDTYLLMDHLTIRLGQVNLAEYVGIVNFAIVSQVGGTS